MNKPKYILWRLHNFAIQLLVERNGQKKNLPTTVEFNTKLYSLQYNKMAIYQSI